MQGTTSRSASPQSFEGDGKTASPGNHFQAWERQEGDQESPAWVHTGEVILDNFLQLNGWPDR